MSTQRVVSTPNGDDRSAMDLGVTRYAMGEHPGGLGLQLTIRGEYVQLTREERGELRSVLDTLFPGEGWASRRDPFAPPVHKLPLLQRWRELRERVPNDTSIEPPVEVLRAALLLRRECEQVTADDPNHGDALWIAARIRSEIIPGNPPKDEVLGPVTVHPLTRDQVVEIARANWQDPVGFHEAVLAHVHVNDEDEYGPGVRDRIDEALTDLYDNMEESSDTLERGRAEDALTSLKALIARIPEDLR